MVNQGSPNYPLSKASGCDWVKWWERDIGVGEQLPAVWAVSRRKIGKAVTNAYEAGGEEGGGGLSVGAERATASGMGGK